MTGSFVRRGKTDERASGANPDSGSSRTISDSPEERPEQRRSRPALNPTGTLRSIPLYPHQMVEAVTPTKDFFVLAHLGVPQIDQVAAWSLEISGQVRRPVRLTLDEVRRRPKRVLHAFHQCAGNPLEPAVPTRRIANVVWSGIDLRALLDEVGPEPDATFLWSYGLDHGEFAGTSHDHYLKDLPLSRVAGGDVLLAYELNGEPLPAEHGFPLRLLVPGFYGTNSVKWLCRLELTNRRATGPFTTTFYNDPVAPTPDNPRPAPKPVWAVPVESIIVSPAPEVSVPPGAMLDVWGWAWGDTGVRSVELSADEGANWLAANVQGRIDRSWQRFRVSWRAPDSPGLVTLRARATSNDGHVQPATGARNQEHAVKVSVTPAAARP